MRATSEGFGPRGDGPLRVGRGKGRLAFPIVAIAVVVAAHSADTAASAVPRFSNPLFADRHTIDRKAPKYVGRAFACAVVTPRTAKRPRMVRFFLTGTGAVPRARQLQQTLRRPTRSVIRTTSARYRATTMRRIEAVAVGTAPRGEGVSVFLESPLERKRCPRVVLTLLPRDEARSDQEQWAEELRRRFGRDRVVVRRATPTLRVRRPSLLPRTPTHAPRIVAWPTTQGIWAPTR